MENIKSLKSLKTFGYWVLSFCSQEIQSWFLLISGHTFIPWNDTLSHRGPGKYSVPCEFTTCFSTELLLCRTCKKLEKKIPPHSSCPQKVLNPQAKLSHSASPSDMCEISNFSQDSFLVSLTLCSMAMHTSACPSIDNVSSTSFFSFEESNNLFNPAVYRVTTPSWGPSAILRAPLGSDKLISLPLSAEFKFLIHSPWAHGKHCNTRKPLLFTFSVLESIHFLTLRNGNGHYTNILGSNVSTNLPTIKKKHVEF